MIPYNCNFCFFKFRLFDFAVEGSHMLNDKRVDVKKALSRDSTGRVVGSKQPRDNAGGNRGGWGGWSGELIFFGQFDQVLDT